MRSLSCFFAPIALAAGIALAPVQADPLCPSTGWQGGYRAPGIGQDVYVLENARNVDGTFSDESFFAAGTFTLSTDGDRICRTVAKWNGLTWEPLGSGLFGTVNAMATAPDGDLIIAGNFEFVDNVLVNNLARWDGRVWTDIGGGTFKWECGCSSAATVFGVVAMSNGDIIVSGGFNRVGDLRVNFIARWDGFEWSPMGLGLNGEAREMVELPNGDLIVAGEFTTAGGEPALNIARWDGTAWSAVGAGLVGQPNTIPVRTLALLPGGDLIAAGSIVASGQTAINGIARWDGQSWSPLGEGITGGDVNAVSIVSDGNDGMFLVATGNFTTAGGQPARRFAKWDCSSWTAMGTGANNQVKAMIGLPGGRIIAGGWFTECGTISDTGYIVRADFVRTPGETTWSTIGEGLDGSANAMIGRPDGSAIVGGTFFRAGGMRIGPIALWNGPNQPPGHHWSPFAPGIASGAINSLLQLPSGELIAGGTMSLGAGVVNIAKWNGSAWSAPGGGTNGAVNTIARAPDGTLFAGGAFTTAGGVTANRIAAWDGVRWSPLGFGVNLDVNAIAFTPSGRLIAGGAFTLANVRSARRLAMWDGASWETIGGGLNGVVYAILVLDNGDIVVGGTFTLAADTPARNIARWDGTAWHPYGPGLNVVSGVASVRTLDILPTGELIAGGNFTRSGEAVVMNLARWEGSRWQQFGGVGNTVRALESLPNGDVLVGGSFSVTLDEQGDGVFSRFFAHHSAGGQARIAAQPRDSTACRGQARFAVVATGTPDLEYQWQTNVSGAWTAILDGEDPILGRVSGAATSDLRLVGVSPLAAGINIRCTVRNGCGEDASLPAELTVCLADFNCDQFIDQFDYLAFVECFESGLCEAGAADINIDGFVDCHDYIEFVAAFESGC